MELGHPESHPFVHDPIDGWKCPCGACENQPASRGGLVTMLPVVSKSFWDHAVKVTSIRCNLCGRQAQTSKAYTIIDAVPETSLVRRRR